MEQIIRYTNQTLRTAYYLDGETNSGSLPVNGILLLFSMLGSGILWRVACFFQFVEEPEDGTSRHRDGNGE
jgi:hypothetical protein